MRMMFRAMMFAVLVALASSSSSYAALKKEEDTLKNVKEYVVALETGNAGTDSYTYDGWMTIKGLDNLDKNSRMALILFLENMRLLSQGEDYENKPEYKKFQKIIELLNTSRKKNGAISVTFHSDANPGGTWWNHDYKKVNVNVFGKEFSTIIEHFIFEICNSANYGLSQYPSVQGIEEPYGVMTEILESGSAICFNNVIEDIINNDIEGINQKDLEVIHNALENEQNFLNPTKRQLIQDALTTWRNEIQTKQPTLYNMKDNIEWQWQTGHTKTFIDCQKKNPGVRKRLEDKDPDNEEKTEKARQEGRKLLGLFPLSNVAAPELQKAADEAKRYFYQPTHRKDDLEYIKRNENLDQLIPSDIRLLQIRMDEIKRHAENINDAKFFLAVQKFLDNIRWALSRDPEKNITMQDLKDLKTHYETDGLDTLLRDNDAGIKGVIARDALAMPAPKPEEKAQDLAKRIEDSISDIQWKIATGGIKKFAQFINTFFDKTYANDEKQIFIGGQPYFFKEGDDESILAFLKKLGDIRNMTEMKIRTNVKSNIKKLITFMKALRSGNVVKASEKLMSKIEKLMNAVVGYVEKYKKGEMDEEELKKLKNKFKDLLGDNGIFVSERIGDREGKSIVQTLIEKWIPQETKNLNDDERGVLNVKMDQARQRIDEILARPDVVHFVRLLSGEAVDISKKFDGNAEKSEKHMEVALTTMRKMNQLNSLNNLSGMMVDGKNKEEEKKILEEDIKKLKRVLADPLKKRTYVEVAFEKQASFMGFLNKMLKKNLSENSFRNFHNLLEELEKPGNEYTKRIFYSILRTYICIAYHVGDASSSLIEIIISDPGIRFKDVMQELEKQFSRPVSAVEIEQMIQGVGLTAKQISVLEEKEVALEMKNNQDLSIKSIMTALNAEVKVRESKL